MQITLITYRGESIHVVLDNNEKLILPMLLEHINLLSNGKTLDQEEYKKLKEESDIYICKQKAFTYLAKSIKSTFEVQKYLQKKGYQDQVVKIVIEFLKNNNYLNDTEFAKKFINYKKRTKTVGSYYLQDQLYKKGLSKDLIARAILETGADHDDLDELYNVAEKKYKNLIKKKNKLAKLVYFLQSRGFNDNTICKTIERLKDSGYKFDDPIENEA
jgi:regulatory protein